jgi:ssDNA-binding Zn-finger/Zn-ribbon topoisomerase 1
MLNCPDCGERLVKQEFSRYHVSQLECNNCEKEFDEQGNPIEEADDGQLDVNDLVELYQEIGGEG